MSNAPYAIVVDGTDVGNVTEHVLGNHLPGVVLPPSVEVISNTVADGVRTVTLRRALVGASPEYHTFDPRKLTLDIIEAVGSTPTLAYHRVKTVSQVSLWPSIGSAGVDGFENVSSAPVCVCSVPALPFGKGEGTLEYVCSRRKIPCLVIRTQHETLISVFVWVLCHQVSSDRRSHWISTALQPDREYSAEPQPHMRYP